MELIRFERFVADASIVCRGRVFTRRNFHGAAFLQPIVAALVCVFGSPTGASEPWFEFTTTNVQALWGDRYELGPEQRQIATVEHANRWRFGDFYGFVDTTLTDDATAYAELSPRVSLSQTGLLEPDAGLLASGAIKDLFVATTLELGRAGTRRYLYGLGADLAVPGFDYLKVNAYQRNDPSRSGRSGQVTISWASSFQIGNATLVIEGFADFVGSEGTSSASQLVVPRVLLDIGSITRLPERRMFGGIEWQYWHNKFGRDGVTESVPQLQLKFVI